MAQGFDLRHLSRYAQAAVVSCSACAPFFPLLFSCCRLLLFLCCCPLLLPLLLLSPLLLPLPPPLPTCCALLLLLPRLPAVSFCCSRSFSYCLFLAWRLAKKDGFGDKRMRSRRLVVKLVAFGE